MSRRRTASVLDRIRSVSDASVKAEIRVEELNSEDGPRHFYMKTEDKSKALIFQIGEEGFRWIDRPEDADKHNVDKIKASLQSAKLVRYQLIKSFKYEDISDRFQFVALEAGTPPPGEEDTNTDEDGKKKKKKKKEAKPAKPAALNEVTYTFSTHQVGDVKRTIAKFIDILKAKLAAQKPAPTPQPTDAPKDDKKKDKKKKDDAKAEELKDDEQPAADATDKKASKKSKKDKKEKKSESAPEAAPAPTPAPAEATGGEAGKAAKEPKEKKFGAEKARKKRDKNKYSYASSGKPPGKKLRTQPPF